MKQFLLLSVGLMMAGTAFAALPTGASAPARLLQSDNGLMAPVWSPSGDMIAATGDNYSGIFVARADGSYFRQVSADQGAGYQMMWADDATIIGRASSYNGPARSFSLRSYNVANGRSAELSTGRELPRVARQKGAESLYDNMLAYPAGITSAVPALSRFSGKMVINPAINADGTKIAFQVPGEGMWIINADGSELRSLGKGSHPAWLPDGETVVFTQVSDNGVDFTASTLFAIDTKTNRTVTLTAQTGMIPMTPAVSPDGKKVAFENAADHAIYVVNLKY